MQTKFRIEDFKPKHLIKANETLDQHLRSSKAYVQTNEKYKEKVFHKSFWDKIVGLFKKGS
ncbi:MAG: hypothetical protein ABXS92_01120 [Sulfurimonas sp.]